MTTATVAGLIAFINTQPVDRQINHASWASCAVGDYACEELQHIIPDTRDICVSYEDVHRDPVIQALWMESGTSSSSCAARYGLDRQDGITLMDIMQQHGLPDTYGSLAALVNDPGAWIDF